VSASRLVLQLLGVSLALPLAAQDSRPCDVVITGVTRNGVSTRFTSVTDANGRRTTYVGGVVDATCEGQGNRLLADSAEHFMDRGLLILYHNVQYSEARVTMTSDKMTYYTVDERLIAEGNVQGRTSSGTRFNGPRMEYSRAKPGLRAQPSWVAVGRPFVRMSPSETGAAPGADADSTDLTADRVLSVNDSLVWASGRVVVDRADMRATADSATVDNGTEFIQLLREPKIVGKGERAFTLDGTVIDVWSKDRQLERVLAAGEGVAVSDSLTLRSDSIDLRFAEQMIQRVFAWGTRAFALGPSQQIESDSMDVRMPRQRLEALHAVGNAIAYSQVDSLRVQSEERDWIAGDTIVAQFETVRDAALGREETRMREVLANGTARAFYQLPPSGGGRGTPNLSYNRGRSIVVRFENGDMSSVTVSESASGLWLEIAPTDTTAAARERVKRP
jgi:lipopolysaccharide export system protein LptA